MDKISHNAIQEVVAEEKKVVVKAVVAPSALAGKWVNCDAASRGLVSVILTAQGNALKVQAFGNCTPTPCDWGTVAGTAYSDNVSGTGAVAFSAQFDAGFKTSILAGYLDHGVLVVENYTLFKDNSGRSSYFTREYFHR